MAEIVDFGLQQHKIKMDSRYFENVLSVVAGDTGRRLEVQLLDTNGMVQNTTGLNLRLNAEIAGKATFTDATLMDAATGKYQLDLSNGMFLAPGNWQFQWLITDSAGKKLHSFAFTGNIGKNISEGGSQATNFYLNLEDLKAMQEDLVNGTIDSSILETNITEKLTDLETQYAPKLTEVTAQLAQKVGDGVLATMNDLGQDVKTTLTGGSVAVVGVGAVNNTNVNSKQITPDKLTNKIVINRVDLPTHVDNHYVTSAGVFTPHNNWLVRTYKLPDSLKKLDLSGSTTYAPVITYADGSTSSISTPNRTGVVNTHDGTLFLNENKSNLAGEIITITITFTTRGFVDEYSYNVIGSESFYGNGYMSYGALTFALGYSSYKVDVNNAYKYKASLTAAPTVRGSLFRQDGTYLKNLTLDEDGYIDTSNADYFVVSVAPNDSVLAESVVPSSVSTEKVQVYSHSVKKPYAFDGKRAYLFGDSIGEGYTGNVGGVTPNTFFSLFANKVGFASVSNSSKGGATFVSGISTTEDIPTSIQSKDLTTRDYVFIAGGTNDYGMGASLIDFKSALESLCVYLKANVTAEVIFITPINRQKPSDAFVASLDIYRNILSEVVLKNGYTLINGKDFSFPEEYGEYQESVMPDGLHPSELGYEIYANDLTTVLC